MKYKVVANQTVMAENVTAAVALRTVCGMLQGYGPDSQHEPLDVKVYYWRMNREWALETYFKL